MVYEIGREMGGRFFEGGGKRKTEQRAEKNRAEGRGKQSRGQRKFILKFSRGISCRGATAPA
jgi:hypothetical protein